MDLNDIWQEHKRFILTVAGGVLVFLIGELLIASSFGEELTAQRRDVSRASRKLRGEELYGPGDLAAARAENDALREVVATLEEAVAFQPRERFRIDPAAGSASSQYFGTVAEVREDLLALAGRSGLRIEPDLGLPALSPTREEEIVRYLEALDLVDRAVRLMIETGVERVDDVTIKLDPGLGSRHGVGAVERTRVEFELSGNALPLVSFLYASQDAGRGAPLLVDRFEITRARAQSLESRMEVALAVGRVTPRADGPEDGLEDREGAE